MSYKHKRREQKKLYAERREARKEEREKNIARKAKPRVFKDLKPRVSRHVETPAMAAFRALPSHDDGADPVHERPSAAVVVCSRELQARQESERLKSQVAPLYPKGPYQLITSPDLPKMFNKKDGGL